MKLAVVLDEIGLLSSDIEAMVGDTWRTMERSLSILTECKIDRVVLTGSGDSLIAATSFVDEFETSGRTATAVPALRLSTHDQSLHVPDRTLVIGISASGQTPHTVGAIRAAAELGARTLAVTATPQSALASAAHHCLALELRDRVPAPGVRTFQALCFGLAAVSSLMSPKASSLSELMADLERLSESLSSLPEQLPVAASELTSRWSRARQVGILGSGKAGPISAYGAAKIVEMSGVFAYSRDLEEWWHVEKFARPYDSPLIIVLTDDTYFERALRLVREANELGRQLAVVQPASLLGDLGVPSISLHTSGHNRMAIFEFAPVLATLGYSFGAMHPGSMFQSRRHM